MAVYLEVNTPCGECLEILLNGSVTFGRSKSCDVIIDDLKTSGKHCCIELLSSGEITVKDLDSRNGTYLNNSKITHSVFKLNDVIMIGSSRITIIKDQLTPKEMKSIGANLKSDELKLDLPEISLRKTMLKKKTLNSHKDEP